MVGGKRVQSLAMLAAIAGESLAFGLRSWVAVLHCAGDFRAVMDATLRVWYQDARRQAGCARVG